MKPANSKAAKLRDAIEDILLSATQPVTSVEIAQRASIQALGVTEMQVQGQLHHMMKHPHLLAFKMVRARSGQTGHLTYEYYNPDVLTNQPKDKVAPVKPKRLKRRSGAVNRVNSPAPPATDFQFDPVGFDAEHPAVAPEPAPPAEPQRKPRAMTISLPGMTVRIEME